MSEDTNNHFLPEPLKSASEIDALIAALRQQLATDDAAWPPTAVSLFSDLSASSDEMENDAMLTILVQDALRGVDIPRKYPQSYRTLLSNGRLRQRFLDLLAALEPNQAEDMPPMPKPDLSFLQTDVSPHPTIHHSPTGWQAAWQLLGDYLANCFSTLPTQSTAQVYRSSYDDLLEEQYGVLLEDVFSVANKQFNILLAAEIDAENPEVTTLSLTVSAVSGHQPPLQATLTWGSYQAALPLDGYGQAVFPPLVIAAILDEAGQAISADLHLVLEPVHS
ncbi:MAG: hypothetical protein R6X34_15875 [Chloroflexota bacterium]